MWQVVLIRGPKEPRTYTHKDKWDALGRASRLAEMHGVSWSTVTQENGVFTVDATAWYTPRKK